ncbi:hypothetical protein AVEN_242480-1 [Araneus ventricosus]|uniref:Uncharacterized protein n=1 Tax=Araneus ventricosus TaxID=182803 RepID=A0A4Y2WI01_ARAVE|nr:hypothetical protein AVEN_242480-1 [Araneus ventricosus]
MYQEILLTSTPLHNIRQKCKAYILRESLADDLLLLLFHVPLVHILDQVHDTMSLQQYHKSIFSLTPQQPRRGANTVYGMSRRSRTGTRARGISLLFVDEFQAFYVATTKSGQCNMCGSCTFGV